ncbi:SET domain-containing protein [Thiohalobacter sp. IOR34]|uniref:SET domain-containing protein n=1 Tax=Thiohalobacter sp. IOR34 TaxID=3057176 RepID=UPI0025B121C4|nr:SET domain-containing protein [Thiohalobacter sp. IOR34]WJW76334.1 SET domain-containing protein [Thiohalobacter sp. IOR34]
MRFLKKHTRQRLMARPALLKKAVYAAPSRIHGKGLFARHGFPEGSYIGTYRGFHSQGDGKYVLWTQLDDKRPRGRRATNLLRYLNHSSQPNAEFDGYDLYALRAIEPGEEITIDYEGA